MVGSGAFSVGLLMLLHVAFRLLMPAIRRIVKDDSNGILALSEHCQQSRSAGRALINWGFWEHPVINHLRDFFENRRYLNRQHRGTVLEVLFHLDSKRLHSALPDVRKPPPPPPPQLADAGPPSVAESAPGQALVPASAAPCRAIVQREDSDDIAVGKLLESLWCKYAGEFLQDQLYAKCPDGVYSVGGGTSHNPDITRTPFVKVSDVVDQQPRPLELTAGSSHGFSFSATPRVHTPVAAITIAEK